MDALSSPPPSFLTLLPPDLRAELVQRHCDYPVRWICSFVEPLAPYVRHQDALRGRRLCATDAARRGSYSVLRMVLREVPDVVRSSRALVEAFQRGDAALVLWMLDAGWSIEGYEWMAAGVAASHRHGHLLRWMHAKFGVRFSWGTFVRAAACANPDLLEWMMDPARCEDWSPPAPRPTRMPLATVDAIDYASTTSNPMQRRYTPYCAAIDAGAPTQFLDWLYEHRFPFTTRGIECNIAASKQRIDALEWLRNRGAPWCAAGQEVVETRSTLLAAIYAGNLTVLQWLLRNHAPVHLSIRGAGCRELAEAAEHENGIEMIRLLMAQVEGLQFHCGMFEAAAAHGRLETLQWLNATCLSSPNPRYRLLLLRAGDERSSWEASAVYRSEAAAAGDLRRLGFGVLAGNRLLRAAAFSGRVDVVRWLLDPERGLPFTEYGWRTACRRAARSGDVATFEFLLRWPPIAASNWLPATGQMARAAAATGSYAILEALLRFEVGSEGSARTMSTPEGKTGVGDIWGAWPVNAAASAGDIGALRLLLERARCPCGERAMVLAAAGGHLEVLRMLRTEYRCEWSERVTAAAMRQDDAAVLAWLVGAGCPWNARILARIPRPQEPDLRCHAYRWAIENGAPGASETCWRVLRNREHDVLRPHKPTPAMLQAPQDVLDLADEDLLREVDLEGSDASSSTDSDASASDTEPDPMMQEIE